jgi:hypothetical protein
MSMVNDDYAEDFVGCQQRNCQLVYSREKDYEITNWKNHERETLLLLLPLGGRAL